VAEDRAWAAAAEAEEKEVTAGVDEEGGVRGRDAELERLSESNLRMSVWEYEAPTTRLGSRVDVVVLVVRGGVSR